MRLENKKIIVTGRQGIGRATAQVQVKEQM